MITRQVLDQWCSQVMTPPKALRLCHETFGPMSPFLLQPSVLALANSLDCSNPSFTTLPKTEIPSQPGSCLVLLGNSNHGSLLREGIVLPLVWLPHCATSEDLPTALQKLGSSVAEQVTSHGTNALGWGLNFDRRFVPEGLTFGNDLFDTFDSAFVALAVGLFAAVQGFEPNIKTVGSAAWSDTFGIFPVAGLVAKIMAAIDFHATDFFLPSWQIAEVLREQPEIELRIKLHPLSSGTQPESLWSAVQPMLAEFASIPSAPVSSEDQNAFDVCVRYHQALPPRSDKQKKFYKSHLLNSIFSRCRYKIAKHDPDSRRQKLVTIVSGEKEVTLITILSVGVKQCLLLHTSDERQTELAKEIEKWLIDERSALESQGYSVPQVCRSPFSNSGKMADEIAFAIGRFTEGCPHESVVLDIKPGNKRMTYSLVRQSKVGNWIFDLNSKFENNLPVPGSEIPELWQAN